MEPRRYMSLATWAKDRIARLESASNDLADDAENDDLDAPNIVSFRADVAALMKPAQEAA